MAYYLVHLHCIYYTKFSLQMPKNEMGFFTSQKAHLSPEQKLLLKYLVFNV
jgi:hypothetical protein